MSQHCTNLIHSSSALTLSRTSSCTHTCSCDHDACIQYTHPPTHAAAVLQKRCCSTFEHSPSVAATLIIAHSTSPSLAPSQHRPQPWPPLHRPTSPSTAAWTPPTPSSSSTALCASASKMCLAHSATSPSRLVCPLVIRLTGDIPYDALPP